MSVFKMPGIGRVSRKLGRQVGPDIPAGSPAITQEGSSREHWSARLQTIGDAGVR